LEGQKYIFTGQIFVFITCLKQIFLGTTKFAGHKKLGSTAPDCPPRGCGPGGRLPKLRSAEVNPKPNPCSENPLNGNIAQKQQLQYQGGSKLAHIANTSS